MSRIETLFSTFLHQSDIVQGFQDAVEDKSTLFVFLQALAKGYQARWMKTLIVDLEIQGFYLSGARNVEAQE